MLRQILSVRRLVAVAAALLCLESTAVAVTIGLNLNQVQNDADPQKITLTISGLNPGQTVNVDRYIDLNGNGSVDPGEPVVQHFVLTDGHVPLIGGQRNFNLPDDSDGAADGTIIAKIFYPGVASFDRLAAKYIYQVSDPTIPAVLGSVTLNVVQDTTLIQGIQGTLTAGGGPAGYAMVALIQDTLVSGTIADENGQFQLYAMPGSYVVIPVFPGYVTDMGNGSADVSNGQFTQKDITLTAGNFKVSGSVTDADSPATPLPGLFVMCQSGSGFAAGFTNTAGQYDVRLSPGSWAISPDPETAAAMGYVGTRDQNPTTVAGDLTRNFQFPKANALVYGLVQTSTSQPVLGLSMRAEDQANQEADGRSFPPDGRYAIGVLAGTWRVQPDEKDLKAMGYMGPQANLSLQPDQALQQNFTLQELHITAHVSGRLVQGTSGGPGIPNINASACPQTPGSCLSATTDPDGNFDIGVFAGAWTIGFSNEPLAQQHLIGPMFNVNVTDGVNQSGMLAVALPANSHITGTVQNSTSAPLAGLNVYASAHIGDSDYSANAQTDVNGGYSLLVADGTWSVGLDCGDLNGRGYECAQNQQTQINQADQVVNFVVHTPAPACTGDCSNDRRVTVNEILTLVSIALGNADVSTCAAGDANRNGIITVDEILAAVNNALNGCGG